MRRLHRLCGMLLSSPVPCSIKYSSNCLLMSLILICHAVSIHGCVPLFAMYELVKSLAVRRSLCRKGRSL